MRGHRPHRALEERLVKEHVVRRGDAVLIACSGGPDSVALAAVLAGVAHELQLQLTLAHVNHGTRRSAWQDEAVALSVGVRLGLPVKTRAVEPAGRDEASLRRARYGALAAMASECGAGSVATGHTAEDQTETVLLALFRGAGPKGLCGMRARRALAPGIDLIRPMLQSTRAELQAYVLRARMPWAVDPSNTDCNLRRNAVRAALATLRPLFPGLDAAASRAAFLVADERDRAPRATARRQVRALLARHEALCDVGLVHVAQVVSALERGRSGEFAMGNGICVRVKDGKLSLARDH